MSKAQDSLIYLEIAGALVAGYFIYKTVGKVGQGAAATVDAAKKVITEDLNPASPKNIIYDNLPQGAKDALGNLMETIFGKIPTVANNVAPTVAPTQNTDNQTQAETQRLVNKATASSGQSAIGYTDSQQITQAIPINFGIIDPSKW